MTVSIKDVASKAGVSAGTVSNVFSGNRAVKPDLARRVRQVAEELGYQPDRAASQLRAGKGRVIAALVPDLHNPFFTSLIASVEASVRGEGYEIIVASSNGNDAEEAARISALLAWRPAGLFIVPCTDEFPSRGLLERAQIPFVVADRVPSLYAGDAVTVDNAAAGRLAARHLIDLGHRDLVVVASTLRLQNIRERCEGIAEAFSGHGLGEPTLIEVGLDFDAAADHVSSFLDAERKPTGLIALTNFGTLAILASLQKWGLRVPDDVSVLGFDDYSWMRAVTPPLTAIRQPVEAMGQAIWQKLKTRIERADELPSRSKLTCELIIRASTAPLKRVRAA